jgi:hypothetical protein
MQTYRVKYDTPTCRLVGLVTAQSKESAISMAALCWFNNRTSGGVWSAEEFTNARSQS